jgi:FtsP/CotA-like multicopper oxidase with cupredoxin domain
MIEAGGSFVIRFTPPRTGTFIYHTTARLRQLSSGLYGPLVVVDAGETFDPAIDHVIVLGRSGLGASRGLPIQRASVVLADAGVAPACVLLPVGDDQLCQTSVYRPASVLARAGVSFASRLSRVCRSLRSSAASSGGGS